jgi:hypothetical protein
MGNDTGLWMLVIGLMGVVLHPVATVRSWWESLHTRPAVDHPGLQERSV